MSQMQDALATKDKRLAMQEAQLAALKKGLPEDVAQAAMKIGELEAKLAEEKKLAARRAAHSLETRGRARPPPTAAPRGRGVIKRRRGPCRSRPRRAVPGERRGASAYPRAAPTLIQ